MLKGILIRLNCAKKAICYRVLKIPVLKVSVLNCGYANYVLPRYDTWLLERIANTKEMVALRHTGYRCVLTYVSEKNQAVLLGTSLR